MKQKLGLACALLSRPRLLLLDEPSVGVDPVSRRELWAIVTAMLEEGRADGMAVVWATAYLDEAARCGRVLLLHQGKLLADAPPDEFLAPLQGRVFRLTVPAAGRRAVARYAAHHPAVLDALVAGDTLRIVLRENAATPKPEELGGIALEPLPPRFEDGFIARLAHNSAPPPPHLDPLRGSSPQGEGENPAPSTAPAIEVRDLVRRFGIFRRRGPHHLRGKARGNLRLAGSERRRQIHHLPHAVRLAVPVRRQRTRRRPGHAARARRGALAHRLHGAALLALRRVVSAGEPALLRPRLRPEPRRADSRDRLALDRFELRRLADTVAHDLPLGLKQRLALAASLLHAPDILFLDEPTSGVDPLTRRDFWNRIGVLADEGVTIMVTSHFMDEAEYCDRLGIVSQGRLAAVGTPGELRAGVRSAELPDPTLEDAFIALVERDTAQSEAA